MKKAGKTIKNVWLWIAAVVMALLGMGIIPHWSFILALLVAVLIVPVQKWQDFLK